MVPVARYGASGEKAASADRGTLFTQAAIVGAPELRSAMREITQRERGGLKKEE